MILGKNVVSREDAQWALDRFAWLIENFCPKYGPLRASLTCVKDGALSLEHYSAQTDALGWAMACFEAIRYQAGMGGWPVEFVARDKTLSKRDTDREFSEFTGHSGNEERYYTDGFGRPVIYFEPARVSEPGYIARRAATMLPALLHMSVEKSSAIRQDSSADITEITAAFLGLGLPLAFSAPPISKAKAEMSGVVIEATHRKPGAKAIFACAVFLSIKGCDGARAKRLYESLIDDLDMERLQDAFAQLRHYKADILRLRTLAMHAEQSEIPLSENQVA